MTTPSLKRFKDMMRILGWPNPFANWLDLRARSDDPPFMVGRQFCNSDGIFVTMTRWPGVMINNGEELQFMAVNKSGGTILNGQPIFISGAQGNRPKVDLPINTNDATFVCIGLATHDIENNQEGRITTEGIVHEVDTHLWTEGDLLYVSGTRGVLTNVVPPGTSYYCAVGMVLVSHIVHGEIGVHVRRTERLGGTTAARPATTRVGWPYFDTTLGKPIWRDPTSATGWSDATGADA